MMIKLEGSIYGEKIGIETEGESPHVCIAVQEKLRDVLDLTRRQGCPKDCPYVIRSSSDDTKHICDVEVKIKEE